jgi:LacI family transcriptional regulator
MRQQRPPQVALIVETSTSYGRQIMAGIAHYLRTHRQWSIFIEEHELGSPPPSLNTLKYCDGILSRPTTPALAELFRKIKVPVVDLNDLFEDLELPWVGSDHAGIGRIAANYFLERGFRSFGYCGFSKELWALKRRDGFRAVVEGTGFSLQIYETPWHGPRIPSWSAEIEQISQWLKAARKPIGVLACNDIRGLHVLDACQRSGFNVPDDVAVIGVDNDVVLCELCNLPLSSVAPDPERIGYVASEILDDVMGGKPALGAKTLIAPRGIVTRRSSDTLAVGDRIVAAALRFIRERSDHGCKVKDILQNVRVSRSVLERSFRKHLRRSPQAEIRMVQIGRVKQLLVETDFKLEKIAELSGFQHPEYMNVQFKRVTGQTPGSYRKQFGVVNKVGQ